MRDKEGLQDYRFMPEPNLPPLLVCVGGGAAPPGAVQVEPLREGLPELPGARRLRMVQDYGLLPEHSFTLVNEDGLLDYFEAVVRETKMQPRRVVGWVVNELLGLLNQKGMGVSQSPVSPGLMAELLNLQESGFISSSVTKQVFLELWSSPGRTARQVVQEKDLGMISDSAEIQRLCQTVLDQHPELIAAIRKGNRNVMNKLVFLVQTETRGRADPVLVRAILEEKTSGTSG